MNPNGSLGFLLGLLFVLAGCGREEKPEKRMVTFSNGKIAEVWEIRRSAAGEEIKHGAYQEYYRSGNNKTFIQYENGRKSGAEKAWYVDGTLQWEKNFEDGKKQGAWRLYHDNGKPWLSLHFQDDYATGEAVLWPVRESDSSGTAELKDGQCLSGDCAAFAFLQDRSSAPADTSHDAKRALLRAFLE